MLSYQHAYHAGNAADLHKHMALATVLDRLTVKPRGITYVETHAGRGLYDLASAEAQKTGEAATGIARLDPGQGTYWTALAIVRERHGPAAYPGSPLIARSALRPQDRIILCELHPAEHRALSRLFRGDPGVAVHRRDGHEGAVAFAPPGKGMPRRGLVLIDPSYEMKDEYARTAATTLAVLRRWPEVAVMVWYPVLEAGRHDRLIATLERGLGAGRAGFWHHQAAFRDPPARGMIGSGLVFINLPWGAEDAVRTAWQDARAILAC